MKRSFILLMATFIAFAIVSCDKDKKPGNIDEPENVVPKEAVDLGIVITRKDGTTYKLYWGKSNLCESGHSTNPEDYGDYYAWGEVKPYYTEGHSQDNPCSSWRYGKRGYDWVSYRFRESGDSNDNVKLTKYNTYAPYGSVDNIIELQRGERTGETVDDAARAKLGGRWRMPTDAEWTALREQCELEWTSQNGTNGCLITASNGNSIFLPAAGYRGGLELENAGTYGLYWSSSLKTDSPSYAWDMSFSSTGIGRYGSGRFRGRSIRPVWE